MKEYIERDAALACVCEDCSGQNGCNVPCVDYVRIKSLPPADVVEVVRCRDCKYKEQNAGRYHVKLPFYCTLHDEKFCDEMEFCSYGAKMDKEDT